MGLGSKHVIAGIVWLALIGVAYLTIDLFTAPKIGYATSETELRLPRSSDGHYYLQAAVNGQPLVFMVDTGATVTSIGEDVARKLQLSGGKSVRVNTANGIATGEAFEGVTISLDGIVIRRVRVIALPSLGGTALLGQNILRHLFVMQTADAMVIRPRDDQ